MTTIFVNTTGQQEVIVGVNGNNYTYPRGTSRADYSLIGDAIILQCAPTGLSLSFSSSSYDFLINGIPYVGTFSSLVQIFNNQYFDSTSISPPPVEPPVTMRANAILTGAYVATSYVKATGRQLLHFDFTITDGGTLANSGCVIAIIQVSDDGTNWVNINNVVAATALVADGIATPFESGTLFRQFNAEYAVISIPYDSSNLPSLPIRISYSTGYGGNYRLWVRASDTAGISSGAPATFPDLEIKATLQ